MKGFKRHFIITGAVAVCSMSFLTACSSPSAYSPVYRLSDCKVSISERNNKGNKIEFDRKYELSDCTVYFDAKLKNARAVDAWIERTAALSALLTDKGTEQVDNVYISDNLIANYWESDGGKINISYPSATSDEEALAWILQARFDNDNNLPYGIFAGVSAFWLEKEEYSQFMLSGIGSADYLTELQFPLYESNNLPERQRSYAWSFSYNIVDGWVRSGHSEKELMTASSEELGSYLTEKYSVALPDYRFFPYSTQYEYKVSQGCFTYYINKQYNDLILPKSRFDTSYDHLSDWLKDNSTTTENSNKVFGVSDMYSIDVYLDDGFKSTGMAGEAYGDYMRIYSAGVFSHEYIHHVLSHRGKSGYLKEVVTDLHANDSKYANLMWYYLLSGEAKHFPYDKSTNEKKSYQDAMRLYNQKSAFTASAEHFDFWLFADCYSALNTKTGQKFIARLQPDSLLNYIARTYGDNYVWQLNMDNSILIEGKTYSEVAEEWIDYLGTVK